MTAIEPASWPPGRAPSSAPPGVCPSCIAPRLRSLLETSAPIHTSKLISSREAAIAYPRGEIRLEICESCAFITNTAFDSEAHDYSASYEETQAFSPRFREFAADLADQLIQRHELAGADVLEVGCGRGDFLVTLCERAGCRGVGVDPSYRSGDVPASAASRVSVRRAFFDALHVDRPFALVVCRHTLEHIHDVAAFLGEFHEGLRRSPSATLLLEIPDTLRILRETAFWDVFYEHCSYFTPGSVARALRTARFRPTALELAYDGQYILVSARREEHAVDGDPLDLEEQVEEVVELADRFVVDLDVTRQHWLDVLRSARADGKSSVIWGAGSKGVAFLATLGIGDEISCVVDVNPAKQGTFMIGSGHEIVAPDRLRDVQPDHVIVMNPIYVEEISEMLRGLDVAAKVSAL